MRTLEKLPSKRVGGNMRLSKKYWNAIHSILYTWRMGNRRRAYARVARTQRVAGDHLKNIRLLAP